MAGTYELKDIQIVITLDEGGANNQYVFQGFATKAAIAKQGGVDFATAQVEIYGLSLEKMGQLTMLAFKALNRRSNAIEILAGEKGTQLMSVFKGQVFVAYADLNGSSPVLKIEAKTAAYPILKPTPQIAVSGTQSVEQLAQSFADEAGMTLKNEGVTGVVSDCVFTGDPITKLRQLSDMVGVDMIPDDGQIVLLPHGESRAPEGSIPVINAVTPLPEKRPLRILIFLVRDRATFLGTQSQSSQPLSVFTHVSKLDAGKTSQGGWMNCGRFPID